MTRDEMVAATLDAVGVSLDLVAQRIGGPFAAVGFAVRQVTDAIADAVRNRGKSVDDILAGIRMPKTLDTSFRADVDARIAAMPPKAPK